MKTLWSPTDREELRQRVRRLEPSATPAWGRFDAPRMMAHVVDQLRMCMGEIPSEMVRTPARYPIVKQLLVYVLPWPKGTPTLPQLLSRAPAEWGSEIRDFESAIEAFAMRERGAKWPPHPLFGELSTRAWGRLGYRHIDHHFTQFGV